MATDNKEKEIGALWKKETNLKKYMVGNIEIEGKKYDIVIFLNSFKFDKEYKPDTDPERRKTWPDFRIYFRKPKSETANENKVD